MTTVHTDSQLTSVDPDMPGFLGAALNTLLKLFSALRLRSRMSDGLKARRDYAEREDIRVTRAKMDLELLRLAWL